MSSKATSYKNNIKQLLPAILLIASTLFYYIPSLIYFPNRDDFSHTFFPMILPNLLIVTIISIFISLILGLIPTKYLKYIISLLLSSSLLLWLQGDYFVTNYGVLDGSNLDFNHFNQRGYYELGIIFLVILISLIFKKLIIKQLPFIVMLIAIGQIGITTYKGFSETNDKTETKNIDDEFFNYSTKKNVILIVLDSFGADYFSKIRLENPSTVDDLTGFVNYTDAISNYPVTQASIPSLLTGKMFPDDMKYSYFLNEIVPKYGMPNEFEKKGYIVSVITTYNWFKNIYKKMFLSEIPIDPRILKKYYGYKLIDFSLFRTMPHFIKSLIYRDGSWSLSALLAEKIKIPNTSSEKGFHIMNLIIERMKLSSEIKRFKMIHILLPHPSYIFDEKCNRINVVGDVKMKMLSQSKCALIKLKEFINKLKALGIYDSSFIAVISDHGARVISDKSLHGHPSYFELAGSSALFMIKGINQKDSFTDIDTPVSLLKLYDLFMDEKNHTKKIDFLNHYGRKFYSFNINNNIHNNYLADAPLYSVKKNNRNPSSWNLEEFVTHKCPLEKIPLMVRFKKNGREEYCAKFGFSRPASNGSGTWTESNDIRIILKLDITEKENKSLVGFSFNFKPSFSAIHKQLDLSWYINGHLIKSSQHNKTSDTNINFQVPLSVLEEKELTEVKITTSKLFSKKDLNPTNSDTRKLGIFMQSIEIE